MATTFARQPQAIFSPPHHGQPTYRQNSTPPSNNVSPTNHSTYLHARQVRQPKQPLYIPAVYRPTEAAASRHNSVTPPRSANNSVDSTKEGALKFTLPQSPPLSPDEDIERSFYPWGQASISRVVTDEWNDDALGAVTGAPTRNHWKVCLLLQQLSFMIRVSSLLGLVASRTGQNTDFTCGVNALIGVVSIKVVVLALSVTREHAIKVPPHATKARNQSGTIT